MPGASPVSPDTPANAAASAAFWSSALERYNLLISMPIPTASSAAIIPIADVARIEPRSRFLFSVTELCFMFPPNCANEDRLEKKEVITRGGQNLDSYPSLLLWRLAGQDYCCARCS